MKQYIKDCLRHIDPAATENDLEEVVEINEFEVYFKFKDGRKTIYDSITGYSRGAYVKECDLKDDDWLYSFGRNIYRRMKYKQVTQEELARLTGVSQSMISNYIQGRSEPGIITVKKIAKVLECRVEDLFYKEY